MYFGARLAVQILVNAITPL